MVNSISNEPSSTTQISYSVTTHYVVVWLSPNCEHFRMNFSHSFYPLCILWIWYQKFIISNEFLDMLKQKHSFFPGFEFHFRYLTNTLWPECKIHNEPQESYFMRPLRSRFCSTDNGDKRNMKNFMIIPEDQCVNHCL